MTTLIHRPKLAWQLATSCGQFKGWTTPLHFLRWWLFGHDYGVLYRLARWLEGARKPRTSGDLDETHGVYVAPGVELEFSGACPVQGDGEVDGFPCYYRTRGEGWQFHVATHGGDPLDDGAFCYWERPYPFPHGGWVHREVSLECIRRGVEAFRKTREASP